MKEINLQRVLTKEPQHIESSPFLAANYDISKTY